MADIDKILEQLLSNPRIREGRAFATSKAYTEEPIIRRGSQMSGYKPQMIEDLRKMQRTPQGRTWSEARLFFEQAKLAEDFEDTCPYTGEYLAYFPTYRLMTDAQLRGYFTWRSHVRRGQMEKAPTSFAYVYIYELLMGIGAQGPEDAFAKVRDFYQAFREFEPKMDRLVRPWLVDFIIDHGMDRKLALPYAEADHDAAISALEATERSAIETAPPKGTRRKPLDFEGLGDVLALAAAIDEVSTYRLKDSRLYKEEPDDLATVLAAVFVRLARRHDRTHSQGFTESLFGTRFTVRHLMYSGAVHYEPTLHADCTYELSPTRSYTCKNGLWSCEGYHDGGSASAKLGDIVRAVDRQLRAAIGFPHALKDHAEPKYLVKIIDDEVSDYLAWKKTHEPVKLELDLSKLAGIRSAAATTCESLLIDEERDDAMVSVSPLAKTPDVAGDVTHEDTQSGAQAGVDVSGAPEVDTSSPDAEKPVDPEESAQAQSPAPFGLSADELAFVRALLDSREPQVAGSVDLLVDSVNEKLYDLLGDTALEFGENGRPRVVGDYADDVREALLGSN